MTGGCCKCCLMFLALWCPPLAVGFHMGCGCDMCINFLLTLLFYFPGLIHAWVIILTKERDDDCHPTVVHVHQAAPAAAAAAAAPSNSVVIVQQPQAAPVAYPPYAVQPPYAQAPYSVLNPEALTEVKGCAPPQYEH